MTFWRQIAGWQYQTYLGGQPEQNFRLLSRYALEQWGLLTVPVYLAGLAGAALLLKAATDALLAHLSACVANPVCSRSFTVYLEIEAIYGWLLCDIRGLDRTCPCLLAYPVNITETCAREAAFPPAHCR